jgi:hypothetical protein
MHSGQPIGDPENAAIRGGPLTRLPVVYAVAIALQRAGVPMAVTAEQLELPAESMPALLEVAAAKLAALSEPAVDDNNATSNHRNERNTRG